jgi:hypothetical protein
MVRERRAVGATADDWDVAAERALELAPDGSGAFPEDCRPLGAGELMTAGTKGIEVVLPGGGSGTVGGGGATVTEGVETPPADTLGTVTLTVGGAGALVVSTGAVTEASCGRCVTVSAAAVDGRGSVAWAAACSEQGAAASARGTIPTTSWTVRRPGAFMVGAAFLA